MVMPVVTKSAPTITPRLEDAERQSIPEMHAWLSDKFADLVSESFGIPKDRIGTSTDIVKIEYLHIFNTKVTVAANGQQKPEVALSFWMTPDTNNITLYADKLPGSESIGKWYFSKDSIQFRQKVKKVKAVAKSMNEIVTSGLGMHSQVTVAQLHAAPKLRTE
jgi:hypothetical protein